MTKAGSKGKHAKTRVKQARSIQDQTRSIENQPVNSPKTSPRLRVSDSPRQLLPRPANAATITLLTDFGSADYFVGAMKGVILSRNPAARLVDISHEISAQDVEAAAFTLLATYPSFAAGTVHVAVVDPGVGSKRRPIILAAADQLFVGPDNGIFSYILDREPSAAVFEITDHRYFREPVSNTFHGRDIFAPNAAALATGIEPAAIGKRISDPVRLQPLAPSELNDGSLRGRIIHIDRFGNCVTNLTKSELTPAMIASGASLRIKGKVIRDFREYFAQDDSDATLFGVWGSAGFLEIASRNRSAAKFMKARRGDGLTCKISR